MLYSWLSICSSLYSSLEYLNFRKLYSFIHLSLLRPMLDAMVTKVSQTWFPPQADSGFWRRLWWQRTHCLLVGTQVTVGAVCLAPCLVLSLLEKTKWGRILNRNIWVLTGWYSLPSYLSALPPTSIWPGTISLAPGPPLPFSCRQIVFCSTELCSLLRRVMWMWLCYALLAKTLPSLSLGTSYTEV